MRASHSMPAWVSCCKCSTCSRRFPDILFHMQIPLTIAYSPESSVYRKWCPEQCGVSPLCKEIRASCTLSKVLGGVTHQPSESVGGPHLLLLQTTPQDPVGHLALDIDLIARHKASLLPAASDQALWAQWLAIILFIPMLLKVVRCRAASLIPPKTRETALRKRTMPRKVRAGSRPQVMSRRHPMVKICRSALTPMTPSPVLVSSLVNMRTPESDPSEKVQSAQQKQHKDSPKEDSPKKNSSRLSSFTEEPLTNKALCDRARQKVWLLDTCFDAWHHDKIANSVMGWVTQDTMICDLPEHGMMQPNHPDPVGPPLDYMVECRVFDGIWLDLYDICHFYLLGTTGNPPEFPALWEPVTCSQVRDLLKLAQSIGHPYMILVHSTNSVTAMSMLQELHMATCLRCLQVDLWDKSVKLSFCSFCAYVGGNNLSYLNHIIIAHYNASYGCGKCLNQAFMSSSALHNHKKVHQETHCRL